VFEAVKATRNYRELPRHALGVLPRAEHTAARPSGREFLCMHIKFDEAWRLFNRTDGRTRPFWSDRIGDKLNMTTRQVWLADRRFWRCRRPWSSAQ
jgi:hypothetical protein